MTGSPRASVQFFGLPPEQYLPLTVRAEELGFEAVWLADHVITPTVYAKDYPYSSSGDPGYRQETPLVDVAVMLGSLASRTRTIRLGAGVFILPLRNPFHVARAWATVQEVSGGRAVLGVGVGWMREEFEALGEEFGARGARTDEMLDVLDLLWRGAPASYRGRHYRFPEVHFGAAPTTPVPVVVGGHSPAALRRAATRGSGWFGPNLELDDSLALMAEIDRERRRAGRSDVPFAHYVRLTGEVSAANLRRYADAGVEHVVLAPFTRAVEPSLAGRLAALEQLADRLG